MRNLNVPLEQIAKEFSKVLKVWLSVEDMAEVVELTKKETDPHICHSDDYCDANMAMHTAMVNLGVLAHDDESDFDQPFMDVFNNAWFLAKKNIFYVEAPTTLEEIIAYLNAKYDTIVFSPIEKDEAAVEDESAPEVLVSFEHNGISIVNAFASDCGRFTVNPAEAYGIEEDDAKLISNYNKVSN